MVGVEHSLKLSAPQLFRFGIGSFFFFKDSEQKDQLINELVKYLLRCLWKGPGYTGRGGLVTGKKVNPKTDWHGDSLAYLGQKSQMH